MALAAAAGVLLSVSNRLYDTDLWQHLAVGEAMWRLREVPRVHLWSWPTYGAPDLVPSWLFRVLLHPFWAAGEVPGLFAWRWLVALATFGAAWAAARRMGARGFAPLVVIVLCSLTYRSRSQVRPEMLAGLLLALELWILEARRHGGRDRSGWIVALAWLWANVHVSWPLGFVLLGVYALDGLGRSARGAGPGTPGRLLVVGALAAAASFVNPYGARLLAQPFEYWLVLRHEPIFATIGELQAPFWHLYGRTGLALLLAGWALLLVARVRRRGLDRAEAAIFLLFVGLGLTSQRFFGFTVVAAAPFVGRDLDELLAAWRRPALPAAGRAALAAGLCLAIGVPEWSRRDLRLGVALETADHPTAALDFMAEHGVRGRSFNHFHLAGFLLHRFWPERDRLPFMDIHQSGTPRDRLEYMVAQVDPRAWERLDAERRLDWVLLALPEPPGGTLVDHLDTHPAWALVFADDRSALWVRRDRAGSAVAERFGYRWLTAGSTGLERARHRCRLGPDSCAAVVAELERAVAASPRHATARSLLANVALLEGRIAEARGHLEAALAIEPRLPRARERLALVALEEGRPAEALRQVRLEAPPRPDDGRLDVIAGRAHARLGDRAAARAAFERALALDPGNAEARDSLAAGRR